MRFKIRVISSQLTNTLKTTTPSNGTPTATAKRSSSSSSSSSEGVQSIRLTLFTGHNCSLCQVFKEQLINHLEQHQTNFRLKLHDIHDSSSLDKNQEKLQSTSKLSSSIPRSSTEEQEGDNDDSQQVQDQGFSSSFFIDLYPQHLNASCYDQPQPSYPNKAFQPEEYLYEPADSQIVGLDDNEPLLHPLTVRRCFNCGDPGHSLTGCPEPRNESLIRLTKQIFQANKNDGALNQSDSQQRPTQLLSLSTEATEETLKRRRFLASSFYPGIVSQALREAIFWDSSSSRADPDCLDPERPMPWFQSMEKWGVSFFFF
ncbi:hypothetical protein BY996DRAFT_4584646 [Phakopsora pachyrhizi]|nr:hypothetical protein BY996DRAFT_4584646 [Phakopsora pachyrhizi]